MRLLRRRTSRPNRPPNRLAGSVFAAGLPRRGAGSSTRLWSRRRSPTSARTCAQPLACSRRPPAVAAADRGVRAVRRDLRLETPPNAVPDVLHGGRHPEPGNGPAGVSRHVPGRRRHPARPGTAGPSRRAARIRGDRRRGRRLRPALQAPHARSTCCTTACCVPRRSTPGSSPPCRRRCRRRRRRICKEARRLAMQGPPVESVGLEPFALTIGVRGRSQDERRSACSGTSCRT